MAYVVARRDGRFEIRESVHTPRGPRARSLANFEVLTDEVLARAQRRATRPFDAKAVIASGERAGAPTASASPAVDGAGDPSRRFVEASRRMARSLRGPAQAGRTDPGDALIDLLGFADAVTASQPPRPFEPLRFPALSRLAASHRALANAR